MLTINTKVKIIGKYRLNDDFYVPSFIINLDICSPVMVGENALGEFKIAELYEDF
ncbi:Uncharacterised protein [Providencia alcalifaciens]|nr:Uncharacterised protein [Providencia alcalifaciens]